MAQLPLTGFSMTLLKTGVSGWGYDFIAIPSFDAIDDQFSLLKSLSWNAYFTKISINC